MNTVVIADPSRRDFLFVAAGAMAAAIVWPLVEQMNPDASTAAAASIEVDLSPIAAGQIVTFKFRGGPCLRSFFGVRLT